VAGRAVPFGEAALRIAAASPEAAWAVAAAVRDAELAGVLEAVPGFDSVLVEFEPDRTAFAEVAESVARLRVFRPHGRGRTFDLACVLDGPDLDEVGALTGLGRDGVRRALLGATLRVAVLGFSPGFAYLAGLPDPLTRVPRRATPRLSVPAGSVAVAGGHAAIYPRATPGGWQLVGRTDALLFDPGASPSASLRPGDRVRLHEVAAIGTPPGEEAARAPRRAPNPVFDVLSPGIATTLQDRGRTGVAHLGVPRAGAADSVAHALANTLVGNGPDAACLEVTLVGPTLLCRSETHVAVVGEEPVVSIDGRPAGSGRVVPVAAGQRLQVESTGGALRASLAVRGGFDGPVLFGSRATDRLSGLGGGPLVAGDELGLAGPIGPMASHLRPGAPGTLAAGGRRTLRVLPVGEGADPWTTPLPAGPCEVEAGSDRIGIRLRATGPTALGIAEMASAGTTLGTVQVPPDGHPVVLLADHATLGGYPGAAVVITAHRGVLGMPARGGGRSPARRDRGGRRGAPRARPGDVGRGGGPLPLARRLIPPEVSRRATGSRWRGRCRRPRPGTPRRAAAGPAPSPRTRRPGRRRPATPPPPTAGARGR